MPLSCRRWHVAAFRILTAVFVLACARAWALVAMTLPAGSSCWRPFSQGGRSDVWLYNASRPGDVRVHLRYADFDYTAGDDCFAEPTPSVDVGRGVAMEIKVMRYPPRGRKYVAESSLAYPVAVGLVLLVLSFWKPVRRGVRFAVIPAPSSKM